MEARPAVTGSSGTPTTLPGMSPDELLGLSDVADALGVSKMTAARYANRSDFPAPEQTPARGRLWSRRKIERWAAKTLPLSPGRPS